MTGRGLRDIGEEMNTIREKVFDALNSIKFDERDLYHEQLKLQRDPAFLE